MKYAVISLLLFITLGLFSCRDQEQGVKPVYRNVTEAVYSTAIVEPQELYTAFAPVAGIIESSRLEEGLIVQQGEVLIVLRSKQSDLQQESARLNLEIARDSYMGEAAVPKGLLEQRSAALAKLLTDSLNYERQARLWAQGIGSRQTLESRELAYELSKRELRRLDNEIERTKAELLRRMQLAENAWQISNVNQEEFTISSKVEGIVYEVFKKTGEAVNPQTPLASIGSRDSFRLKMLIDEVDIASVRVGQKAILRLDAYGDQVFQCSIHRIYPSKDERSQTFTVEATFDEQPERLFKGLSGEANIVIARKENVLTLPREYVSAANEVRTAEGEVTIETGLSDLNFVEIVSGIDTSTVVYELE